MASFNVFLCFLLHVLFLISCSGTRLFHPFSIYDQTLEEEAKAQNKASSTDKVELIVRHFESKQFAGVGDLALAGEAEEHPKTSINGQKTGEKKQEYPKQFPSIRKRTLIEEGKEAIYASIRRNDGIPDESDRLSPGGPDAHHH
ncbi:hypothetical protein PTKIN_Ptkin11bG0134900 [Pterospermum kingtungense]